MVETGAGWEAKQFTMDDVKNLQESGMWLLEQGFVGCEAVRKGATKAELTKMLPKLKSPDDVFVGAQTIENVSFNKRDGDFQGMLLIFRDKLVFVSSLAYQLKNFDDYYRPEAKEEEKRKLSNELRDKAKAKGFSFAGDVDSFSLIGKGGLRPEMVKSFLKDVMDSMAGLKLRARM